MWDEGGTAGGEEAGSDSLSFWIWNWGSVLIDWMEGGGGREKAGCAPRLLGVQLERVMRRTGAYLIWVRAGKVHSAQQGLHLKLRQETEDSKVVIWIL